MPLFAICLLVIVVVVLVVYNISINKRVKNYSNLNQKITSLNILKDFMDVLGEDISSVDKIKKLNNILLDNYQIKYSTIVAFNGAEYEIKASNVNGRHWNVMKDLSSSNIFLDNISNGTSKYLTTNGKDDKLPYLETELDRARSAMFFPLYIDNVYIGYWIIENEQEKAYDNIDTTMLEVVKENIITIIKSMEYQTTIENTLRKDLFTGLYGSEYLFGEGRKKLNEFATSAICMFSIINLPQINEKANRKTGNTVVTKVSELVKENIANEHIFIRYFGNKFIIAFGGIDVDAATNFLINVKSECEKSEIPIEEEEEEEEEEHVTPILNFVITTYYKGTPIEGVVKKLEEYIITADKNESDINIM